MIAAEPKTTGQYQAYPEYKDSGVEWLGNIPAGWHVNKLKYLASLVTKKASNRIYPIGLENIESWTGRFLPSDSEFQGEGIEFVNGDILFGKLRPYLAKVMLAGSVGEAVGDFHVIRPVDDVVSRYLQYQLLTKEFISVVDGSTFGAKMPRVSWEFMAGLVCAQPSKDEAISIATFLDYETARIDQLITLQQRLIELLKEKRQAVISHAVTKGLNPNAPMKDSGVEWLGQVPDHWNMSKVKQLCYVNDGNHGEEYPTEADFVDAGEGVPFIRAGDFDNFKIIRDDLKYISQAKNASMRKGRLQAHDILFVNRGASIAKTCIINEEFSGANLNSQVAYIRPEESMINFKYLAYFLTSTYIQTKVVAAIQGGALPQYPLKLIQNLDIWRPDLGEQVAIVEHIDNKMEKIDKLIQLGNKAISYLSERRTALISAAVTGKIDLRDWTPTVDEVVV